MSHVLVVEDEHTIRMAIHATLTPHYTVSLAETVAEATHHLRTQAIDLVLLDLQLGAEDGMHIAKVIREQSPHVAIVILTGQGSLKSAIQAVEVDAQAYLLKPIGPDELERVVAEQIAHMQEIKRRDALADHMQAAIDAAQNTQPTKTANTLTVGRLRVDRDRYEAFYDGHELSLSTTQFRILWQLVDSAGKAVSAKALALDALGYDVSEIEAGELIKGHISKIRRKLAAFADDRTVIRTVRNEGYLWVI